ncbi:MAG TPA: pyruvate kinase [Azospirillum sp.]|nr:pyruvate kinase [Azospirillum sp.]
MTGNGHPLRPPGKLLCELMELRRLVTADGRALFRSWRADLPRRSFAVSALNFAHYLVLRRRDLRPLQAELMVYGLSSLGRLEGRVLANLDAVIGALRALSGEPRGHHPRPLAFSRGERLLHARTDELFGPAGNGRDGRILVTLPPDAAAGPELLTALLRQGTDAVRINCAHDTPDDWTAMIAHLRTAEAATGRRARVLMDLPGPKVRTAEVRHLPGRNRLETGDRLLLTAGAFIALDHEAFQASCILPSVIGRLQPGDPVFMDDGKIRGHVERGGAEGALVHITHAPAKGVRLKADKGLNFPATDLGLAALTDEDRTALDVVAHHADMVGYSFVQSAGDVQLLQDELAARRPGDWQRVGLVAKIETPVAVRNLPEIIVQAASRQPFGVMIARGDLAVELGFERLAEMQEEILWLCEAAHVPVIWATQVLESLIKKGLPTRGDMTDAAMSARAECVMLNKGPYLVEAVDVLSRLLVRMAEHQTKKTPKLRALRSWTVPRPPSVSGPVS